MRSILISNLQIRQVNVKFFPRFSLDEHIKNLMSLYIELKGRLEADPEFMANIMTEDESWVYGYNSEMKMQSFQ